ncbi:MAG TPA: hypothetical protein VII06_32220 [Chloroflexota bacterium]|jgi:hypothetical protein
MTVAQTRSHGAAPYQSAARGSVKAHGATGVGEHLAAGALIVAATLVLLAPMLGGQTLGATGARMFLQFPWAGTIADGPDVRPASFPQTDQADQLYPLTVFLTDALRERELPLWLPWALGGVPLTALAPLGLLYPARWALAPVLDPGRQHDVLLLCHLLLAGLGMYALLRTWGAVAAGAVVGALVWEFGGYNVGWLLVERAAIAAAWLPLALLAATLAVRRRSLRWALGAGGALGLGALGGGLDLAILSGLLVAGWLLVAVVAAARTPAARRSSALIAAALALASLGVAAAVAAALWLPLLAARGELRLAPASAPLGQPLGWGDLARGLLLPATSPPPGSLDLSSLAYVGYPALLLAVLAVGACRPAAILAGAVGALALLAATGVPGALPGAARLYRLVPPSAWLFAFAFAAAALAAIGLTVLWGQPRAAYGRWRRLAAAGAVAVTLWQLLTYAIALNPVQPASAAWRFPATPLADTLRSLQRDTRILPVGPTLVGDAAAAFGVRSVAAYLPLVPTPVADLWEALAPKAPSAAGPKVAAEQLPMPLLNALGVGLIATPPGTAPTDDQGHDLVGDTLQPVYTGQDGWVYQNTAALPRAFVAPGVLLVADAAAAHASMQDPSLDPSAEAVIAGTLPPAQAAMLGTAVAGTGLTIAPNPVPPGQEAQLTWNAPDAPPAEVRVSEDGGPEVLVARGPSGTQSLSWIRRDVSYEFRLYANDGPDNMLDAVTVTATPVLLALTPSPVVPGEEATLSWSTADGLNGEVWVAEDDEPEALVARAPSGTLPIPWITRNHTYEFRLYAGEERAVLIATTTVSTLAATAGRVDGARLAVAPNPLTADGQVVTLTWGTPGGDEGEVWVAQDGGAEALVARGPAGSQRLNWLGRESTYEFRLYAGQERRALLATTTVAPPLPTDVGLTVGDRIVAGRRQVTLSWRMPDRKVGQVWVTADGTDMLVAQSPGGSRDLPWISPNVTYQFQLYAGTSRSALIDLKSIRLDGVDTRRERVLPGSLPAPPVEAVAAWRDGQAGRATIVRDGLREVALDVNATRPGMLVLNDTWAPGWRATVDGADAPVLRVNYGARGLVVPAGHHEVVFRYVPGPLLAGLGVTAAALGMLAGVLLVAGFGGRPRQRGAGKGLPGAGALA